ncbi:MAG: phosphatase PAP2 family protein [Dokdonella sp.]
MELKTLLMWADHHAPLFFVFVLIVAAASGWFYWRRRGPWNAGAPVPMLRRSYGMVIAMVTSVVFAALAFAIEADGRLVAFDQNVTNEMHENLGPAILNVLAIVTQFGGSHQLMIASAVIAVLLLLLRRWLLAAGFALSMIGNGLLIRIGKDYFQRVRPVNDHGPVIETGYSFPSGHAAGSMMFYGMLAYLLMVLTPARWHGVIIGVAIAVIALIGCSRVLLQVHFVSDVCAGYALAVGWGALCVSAIEFLRTSRLPKPIEDALNYSKSEP